MGRLPFDVDKLIALCRQYDIVRIGVFRSVARGEANERSDIDLLVEFSKLISLLRFVALERELSNALGRRVDLLTEAVIRPYLCESVERSFDL